jgi:hypothetical protein
MTDRDIELMRRLSEGGGGALCADLTARFGEGAELGDLLRSLEARGLVQVLDPFGTDHRCVLTEQGTAYLRHHEHVQSSAAAGGPERG